MMHIAVIGAVLFVIAIVVGLAVEAIVKQER